jgi:hypothetical protein
LAPDETVGAEAGGAGAAAPADDGIWELGLGTLLFLLALTLDTGRMPVLGIVAVPFVAALLRWTITRPRLGPAGFRQQLGALRLGPMGLLCGLVVVGAVVIGAMARDGREAFEPARSAAPGIAAAAILALAVISALLGGRLRSSRFLVWAGLALVGLLLEPIAAPEARSWTLRLLSVVIVGAGAWQLWRFVKGHGTGPDASPPGTA